MPSKSPQSRPPTTREICEQVRTEVRALLAARRKYSAGKAGYYALYRADPQAAAVAWSARHRVRGLIRILRALSDPAGHANLVRWEAEVTRRIDAGDACDAVVAAKDLVPRMSHVEAEILVRFFGRDIDALAPLLTEP